MTCRAVALGFAALALAPAARAQDRGGFCFHPRPLPECRTFVVTEALYLHRLSPGEVPDAFGDPGATFQRHNLQGETGVLRNVSAHEAVGVTVAAGYDWGFEATRLALKVRARRWIGQSSSVEIAAGPAWTSNGDGFADGLGAALQGRLNLADQVSFAVAADFLPEPGPGPLVYVGGGLGGRYGRLAWGAGALLGLAALLWGP
jgi:hypothetical protein